LIRTAVVTSVPKLSLNGGFCAPTETATASVTTGDQRLKRSIVQRVPETVVGRGVGDGDELNDADAAVDALAEGGAGEVLADTADALTDALADGAAGDAVAEGGAGDALAETGDRDALAEAGATDELADAAQRGGQKTRRVEYVEHIQHTH